MNDYECTIKIEIRTYKKPNRLEYSDVYMDGVRIMHKHLETHAETFLDGTVLGIHGIVTDNSHIRKQTQWMVFTTAQAQPLLFDAMGLRRDAYSSANIQTIKEIGGRLYLMTDTHACMSYEKSSDANHKFIIERTYINEAAHKKSKMR